MRNQPQSVATRLLFAISFLLCFAIAGLAQSADSFDPKPGGMVSSIIVQPDGKILVLGSFQGIGGEARDGFARLNADGTLDAEFNVSIAGVPTAMALQSDGKILIGGSYFTNIGGEPRLNLARLNPDGTVDSFNPSVDGGIHSILVQPDGKIIVAGGFGEIAGHEREDIARLNADGSLDTDFNSNKIDIGNTDGCAEMQLQDDGKILVACGIARFGLVDRNYIARLDGTTGAVDSFNPNPNFYVTSIAVQEDDKIIIGGAFNTIGGVTRNNIAKLNEDGSLDDFNPNSNLSGIVFSVKVQPNGKILVGGGFTTMGGQSRNGIARLNPDGSADSFNPNAQNQTDVREIAFQPDGKILLGGYFEKIGTQDRKYIARVYNSPTSSIAGTVTYGITPANQNPKSVSGVLFSVSGTTIDSTNSNSVGAYSLNNLISGGQYTITPSKTGNVNGITAFDATLVLRCVAAGNNCALSANQKITADSDADNNVTAFDATQILRYVAANGSNANTGIVGKWKFDPASKSYSPLNNSLSGEDYTAFLIGEVDGDWAP